MNSSFKNELVWTNYILIGSLILMFVAANLYYGATSISWMRILPIIALIILALVVKLRMLNKKGRDLDERMQYLTYRALAIGFYFFLGAVLWFYTKEIVLFGHISKRTLVELIAGMIGYVGGFFIFRKLY